MNYESWSQLKKGDRVKGIIGSMKGTIISAFGVGKVIKWDDGRIERVQNLSIELLK